MRPISMLGMAGLLLFVSASAAVAECPTGVASADSFTLVPPVDRPATESFGKRKHPVLGFARMHNGVDFAAPVGEAIRAAASGFIYSAKWTGEFGNRIEIDHGGGVFSTYSHMSRFSPEVAQGRCVLTGEVIGYVGATGLLNSPHLHFEIIADGAYVDPALHITK